MPRFISKQNQDPSKALWSHSLIHQHLRNMSIVVSKEIQPWKRTVELEIGKMQPFPEKNAVKMRQTCTKVTSITKETRKSKKDQDKWRRSWNNVYLASPEGQHTGWRGSSDRSIAFRIPLAGTGCMKEGWEMDEEVCTQGWKPTLGASWFCWTDCCCSKGASSVAWENDSAGYTLWNEYHKRCDARQQFSRNW